MELAGPDLLRALLAGMPGASRRPIGPRPTAKKSSEPALLYQAPARKSSRRRCHCGACPQCADNAKWERIFQEKFADPLYYSDLTLRRRSPLTT
jgi:hypothetical protein